MKSLKDKLEEKMALDAKLKEVEDDVEELSSPKKQKFPKKK